MGRLSKTTIRGSSAAGSWRASTWRARAGSMMTPSSGTMYPASTWPPPPVFCSGRGGARPRQRPQRRVDLAQFDPAAAELDLIVGPAMEQQASRVGANQIAAAVAALPAKRWHGRILPVIQGRVQVAAKTHATDHQFPGLAPAHGLSVWAEHGQLPAVQRQADADRAAELDSGAAEATTVASVGP